MLLRSVTLLFLISFVSLQAWAKASQLEELLKKSADRANIGEPLNCPGQSQFSYVYLTKSSISKKFNKEKVCQLVTEYEHHVYSNLQNFWPLNKEIGFTVRVEESRSNYNAAFSSNLGNPFLTPSLLLIYIEGIPIFPQRFVWTHEYGHAVLDDYVRKNLNSRFDFDEIFRNSLYGFYNADTKTNEEYVAILEGRDSLYEQRDRLKLATRPLHERRDLLYDTLKEKRRERSDKERAIQLRSNLLAKITNIKVQIRNEYIGILSQQGHLDNFPDGRSRMKEYIEKRDRECQQDPLCRSMEPIYFNDKEKIRKHAQEIQQLLTKEKALEEELGHLPASTVTLREIEDIKKLESRFEREISEIAAQVNQISLQARELDGQIGKKSVLASVVRAKYLIRSGSPKLPGQVVLSYYHEFFADLFAAVFHNSPNAIGDSFSAIGLHNNMSLLHDARRFSPLNPEPLSLDNWHFNPSIPHHFFTPARAHFGGADIHQIVEKNMEIDFLREVLELVSSHIIDYTFNRDPALFESYAPILDQIRRASDKDQFNNYFTQLIEKRMIDSGYIDLGRLKSWCEYEYESCRSFLIEELTLAEKGVLSTPIRFRPANQKLIDGLELIKEKLLKK